MQVDVGTVMVTALLQTAIGWLFRMTLLRQVEKMDALAEEVRKLKDEKVAGIAAALAEHAKLAAQLEERASAARKEVYSRLGSLEKNTVTVAYCRENHREAAGALLEFRDAVVSLAALQADLKNTALFVSEVNQRVIALIQDVAKLEGRTEGGHG